MANRVGGRVSPPASHTTVHAGPRTAISGSPLGRSSTLSLPRWSLPGARPVGLNAPRPDHRWSCLPAKFSPSRVVRPSGLFVSGSLLSVLWPLLTPVPARRPLLTAVPTVAGGLGLQASLSKDVNSRCTTGPFISGAEHWTALCGASLSAPSTLYGLSVRRLISFDLWLPSHGTSRFRSCLGLMFWPSCPSL
jgi:hypothetical protein